MFADSVKILFYNVVTEQFILSRITAELMELGKMTDVMHKGDQSYSIWNTW